MPEVVKAPPVRENNQAQYEQRHEHEILSDHDALLLLSFLAVYNLILNPEQSSDIQDPCE